MDRKKVIIIGAAGRDFHNFNVLFRDNQDYEVVAFTANQIPYISDRNYPQELCGHLYKNGIRIHDEKELPKLIRDFGADICVLSYSDLQHEVVMQKASLVNASGADFWLVAPEHTMIRSKKPVIAICGTRTGVGKSQTARYVANILRGMGFVVGIVRHPMPYGNLRDQVVQRFSSLGDMDKYKATLEEREDYEPHIKNGFVVYAGVDYEKILRLAESESDIVLWDGGNNDTSFYKPDLLIGVADPLRAGNEVSYYPGEIVAMTSDVILINKINSAKKEEIARVFNALEAINPKARILLAESIVSVDNKSLLKGKSVLLVEDGPTITHGGMVFGAATVAAREYGVGKIVNAKRYAIGSMKEVYQKYPQISDELPAMGYSIKQLKDLESTLIAAECDVVLSATPTNLRRLVNIDKPIVQVFYELKPKGNEFDKIIKLFAEKYKH